jgi:PAS domain S-box-containing protein
MQSNGAVAQSRQRLQAIFEFSLDPILLADNDGRFVDANPAACQLLGYSLEELLQRCVFDVTPLHNRAAIAAKWRQFLIEGKLTGAYTVLCKGGDLRKVECRGVANIRPGLHLAVQRDITERHRAEEKLRSNEAEESLRTTQEFLSLLLENIPAGVCVNSTEGRVRLVNKAGERFFGLARDQVLGRCLEELLAPEVAKSFRASDRRVIDTGAALAFEEQIDIHGCLCWFHTVKFPLYDGAGRIEAVGGISMDITERRLAEETMRIYADRLHTLSRRVVAVQEEERRRLAHELHDEIGQVLTAISMGLYTAKKTAGSAAGPHLDTCLEIVSGAIEQVRSLSLRLRPASLDLVGLEAAVRWNLDRQARQGGLVAQLESNLGGQRLPAELEIAGFRVFQEALTNVVRHAQAHHLLIKIDLQERELHLVIEDDGVGFDVAACERRATQGRSFGLAGMRERVMLSGGHLIIHSQQSGGTKIHACLPLGHAPLPTR